MIDNSKLQTYLDCGQKYKYKYVDMLSKFKDEEGLNIDLNFGKLGHKCLELYYKDKRDGIKEIKLEKYVAPFDSLVETPNNKIKTKEAGRLAIKKYIERWTNQEKDWEILDVEGVYTMEVIGIPYTFKIDLVIRYRDNIYVIDNKFTAKKDRRNFFRGYELNAQMTGYCWLAEKKFKYCSGFYVNAVFVGHRARAYKGEPAGYWCVPERQMFNRYPQQLVRWEVNVGDVFSQIERCKDVNVWTKDESGCNWCEYKMLCQSCNDTEIRELHYVKLTEDELYSYLKEGTNAD